MKIGKVRGPAKLLRASQSVKTFVFIAVKEGVVIVCQVAVKLYLFTWGKGRVELV